MKRIETEELIGQLIANMDFNLYVETIIDLGGSKYRLETCNTLYLQAGYQITINSVVRTITSVNHNVSIDIEGGPLPTEKKIAIYAPFYRHGTIITTNNEINKKSDALDITPLVYLRTEFTKTYNDRDKAMDRESDLEIYFLTQNSFEQTEADIRKTGVLPMRNLAYMFIDYLKSNKNIGIFNSHSLKNWTRFGFETANGQTKKIFNYVDLSGCQLNISLPIGKDLACCK